MKIVHAAPPPHSCHTDVDRFADQQAELGKPLHVGSIVECRCGRQMKLADTQRDGAVWQWHHPDSGGMGKR